MPPGHKKVLHDIIARRTEVLGGEVCSCDAWQECLYSYHSCGNRRCPKCGQDRVDRWRDTQFRKLLPPPLRQGHLHAAPQPEADGPLQPKADLSSPLPNLRRGAHPDVAGRQDRHGGGAASLAARHGLSSACPRSGPGRRDQSGDRGVGRLASEVSGARLRFTEGLPGHIPRRPQGRRSRAVRPGSARDLAHHVVCALRSGRERPTCRGISGILSLPRGAVESAIGQHAGRHGHVQRHAAQQALADDDAAGVDVHQPFLQHGLPQGFQKIRYVGFLHPSAKARVSALQQCLEDTSVNPRDWSVSDDVTTPKEPGDTQHTPDHPGVCPHCGAALRYVGRIPRSRPGMLPLVSQRGPPERKEEDSS